LEVYLTSIVHKQFFNKTLGSLLLCCSIPFYLSYCIYVIAFKPILSKKDRNLRYFRRKITQGVIAVKKVYFYIIGSSLLVAFYRTVINETLTRFDMGNNYPYREFVSRVFIKVMIIR